MTDTAISPAARLSLLGAAPLLWLLPSAAGSAWTLPAGTESKIGLLSLGKAPNDPAATSRFDYFRVYAP